MNEAPVSVLVVDDHPNNRTALVAALTPLGLRFVEAGSGRAAMRALLDNEFAAMLLDINLPDMNGYEVAELVRARPRNTHLPILFITAERAADVDRQRGYACGAVDYLLAPVVPAILRAKVSVYADQFRSWRDAVELSDRFAALVQLGVDLAAGHEFRQLIQLCCGAARNVLATRYAGIVMTADVGAAEGHVVTVGLDEGAQASVTAEIAHCAVAERILGPGGTGPLAIAAKSGSIGLPDSHPLVTDFLGCRIAAGDNTLGWIYVADRATKASFDFGDERIIFALAGQIAMAWNQRTMSDKLGLLIAERTRQLEELDGLARSLAEARDQANAASKAKSQFLTGITHELRTPLHGILGYTELLKLEGGLSATQTKRVIAMMETGDHLLAMINTVLDMSQIEANRLELHPDEIDLSAFMRACRDIVRPSAEAKGLELTMGDVPTVRFFADAARLRQVVVNLLGNAIKFTSSGVIELRTARTAPDRLRVEVADTGPGIAGGQRGKLFQTFERLDTTPVQGIQGSGLGLALSAQLVQLMGGQVGYDDNPGGGSVFWLELPLRADPVALPADAPAATAPEAALVPVQALHLLVVDDVLMNRKIADAMLRAAGHTVTCAEGGADAVAAASGTDFDVILMDVRMREMDGLEATRRIRALGGERGRVPIVALTALALPEQVKECREAGMDGYLSKPFNQATLLAAIARVVGGEWSHPESPGSQSTPVVSALQVAAPCL